jgi:hypothetical protein
MLFTAPALHINHDLLHNRRVSLNRKASWHSRSFISVRPPAICRAVLDNETLIKRFHLAIDPEWIVSRTGIQAATG